MTRYVAIALILLTPSTWGGDEFRMPAIREGSAYESSEPRYQVVGIEDHASERTLFVVADPAVVLTHNGVNRIIKDIQCRSLGFTEILFYSSVRDQPNYPAFAIYDHLAVYRPEENKTYYGVAAKALYGGWAHGPPK